eukprot:6479854-Amphidinium_carterae.1
MAALAAAPVEHFAAKLAHGVAVLALLAAALVEPIAQLPPGVAVVALFAAAPVEPVACHTRLLCVCVLDFAKYIIL